MFLDHANGYLLSFMRMGDRGGPRGEDHVKGRACLGCKRNSLRLEGQLPAGRTSP